MTIMILKMTHSLKQALFMALSLRQILLMAHSLRQTLFGIALSAKYYTVLNNVIKTI